MSEKLRDQYLAYLAQYDLEPHPIPPETETAPIQEAIFEHMKNQWKASEGDSAADWFEERYKNFKERNLKETRHPSVIFIETAAAKVEQSIQSIDKYRDLLKAEVFAGEFPTGSINAQVVKAEGGYLVLINSGFLSSISQVAQFLNEGDPDDYTRNGAANRTTIDGIVAVLQAYMQYGDPFFGPKPLSGGVRSFIAYALMRACLEFVVAHEYGHIIAGHFDGQTLPIELIETNVGTINVIKKEWAQELEADVIAHKIVLGIGDYAQLDLAIIDKAESSRDMSLFVRALEVKAAIAAPFIVMTIDAILDDVQDAVRVALHRKRSHNTHPTPMKRIENLMPNIIELEPKYNGYINFAAILWRHYDEIYERLVRAMFETLNGTADTD